VGAGQKKGRTSNPSDTTGVGRVKEQVTPGDKSAKKRKARTGKEKG